MNRRSFLRGLLALPFAPLAAKLLSKPLPKPLPKLNMLPGDVVYCPSGSDQTSIWMASWGEDTKFMEKMSEQLESKFFYYQQKPVRNWLKESIRGN